MGSKVKKERNRSLKAKDTRQRESIGNDVPKASVKLAPAMRGGDDDEVSDHTWMPNKVEDEREAEVQPQ